MGIIKQYRLTPGLLFTWVFLCMPFIAFAESMDGYKIGGHGQGNVKYPAWFKESFLDLRDDLAEAKDSGKRGIIIMFSQKNCAHCQAFVETTFSDALISERVRRTYDVIALDIFSDNFIYSIDGTEYTIKNFAEASKSRLTPTLIFIGVEKKALLKIVGFYPPEKFSKVLDYIDGSYNEKIRLGEFLRDQESSIDTTAARLNYDYSIFSRPPYDLSSPAGKPVRLVFFERPGCNSCQRFHDRVLSDNNVRDMIKYFHSMQLNAADNTSRLITPEGKEATYSEWADTLELNYDYSLIFYDDRGNEVHRIDSEAGKDRTLGSMQYVLEKAYLNHEQFLQWRKEQALKKQNGHE